MYLEEFVNLANEMFQDADDLPDGVLASPNLAKISAAYIVELIERGFDAFSFIELIYYENSFYERIQGFKLASSEEEIPF